MENVTIKPKAMNIIVYTLICNIIAMPLATGLVTLILSRMAGLFSFQFLLIFWLTSSLTGIYAGLLGRLLILQKTRETETITIADGHLWGPGRWIWQRKSLDLGKLDEIRSRRRNLYQRLFALRSFWSLDGEMFVICGMIYGEEQIYKILEILNLKD